ncbi:hypothetical protein ANCCAN_17991, partial [Ancylostoma caninum]
NKSWRSSELFKAVRFSITVHDSTRCESRRLLLAAMMMLASAVTAQIMEKLTKK